MVLSLSIRWMITRDIPEVIEIENSTGFWTRDDLVSLLRQKNVIGMVIELVDSKKIVGFMVYELLSTRISLLNLSVHPEFRRQKVGSSLMLKLIGKLAPQKRIKVVAELRESNLFAQLFLKAIGFKAVEVLRSYFEDTDEDAYVMEYKLQKQDTEEEKDPDFLD